MITSPWNLVSELIESAFASPGHRSPRTFLLKVAPSGCDAVADAWSRAAAARDMAFATVECARPFPVSFEPLRELMAHLIPIVADEAPDLLQTYSAELTHLLPSLPTVLPELRVETSLAEIALGPSERRLHKESEVIYRTIHAATALVKAAAGRCPSLSTGLVLFFRNLDRADRNTMKAFYRLSRRIRNTPVTLVATVARLPQADPANGEVLLNEETAAARLVEQIISRTSRIARVETINATEQHAPPPGSAPAAEKLPMTQALLKESGDEADRIRTTLTLLEQEAIPDAIAAGFQALQLMFESLNHEGTFLLVKRLLPWTQHNAAQAIQLWKYAGPAHAFLLDYREAIMCYEAALRLAETPVQRAQLKFFIGLLRGKRLNDLDTARNCLQSGFREIEGLTDGEAMVEFAWLSNVSALCCFSERKFQEAINFCRPALTKVNPFRDSEAVHIKVNLISNITVVLESVGDYAKSVDMWQYFRGFLGHASDILAKHYCYREGGLHLRNGSVPTALSCYEQCYEYSCKAHDDFHAEIAARAVGYIHWQEGRYDEALTWYQYSLHGRLRLDDDGAAANAYLQVAAVQRCLALDTAAGETAALALEHNELAAAEDPKYKAGDIAEAAERLLAAGDREALAAACAKILDRPGTKLNRPFTAIIP